MRISEAMERVLTARTRTELIDAVTAGASEAATCDGVRFAEGKLIHAEVAGVGEVAKPKDTEQSESQTASSLAYRVLARGGPAPDPSPAIVRSPLSSPLVAEYVRTRFYGWVSMQDLLPGRLWATHPLYLQAYRPVGLSAQITCVLHDTGKFIYSLSLNRAGRDFSEPERDRLEQYRRLVQSAWLRVEELEALRSILPTVRDEYEDNAMVVLILDRTTPHIAYCTEAMKRLLSQRRGLWDLIRETATTAGTEHVGSRIARPATPTLDLIAEHTGNAVLVHAVPVTFPHLTGREREILEALSAGHTARAIGHRLGISERTVRKHLEHLYAKIGVHDRLGAVTLARRARIK